VVPYSLAWPLPRMFALKMTSPRCRCRCQCHCRCVPTTVAAATPTETATDNAFTPFQVRFAGDTCLDDIHTHFMKLALEQAAAAAVQGEVPIGAVVVRRMESTSSHLDLDGDQQQDQPDQVYLVLSVARNAVEETHDASAHAELLALRAAATNQQPPNWRLSSPSHTTTTTTLYSTLEPCPMCLTAAQAFRIQHIVYGARDDRLGAVETHMRLLQDYQHPFHNITYVTPGVQADKSAGVLSATTARAKNDQATAKT
jgi:tRNA(adenine34) deaminase